MRFICGLAFVSLLSWGQDAAPKVERRLIQIKYVEANRVQRLNPRTTHQDGLFFDPIEQFHPSQRL